MSIVEGYICSFGKPWWRDQTMYLISLSLPPHLTIHSFLDAYVNVLWQTCFLIFSCFSSFCFKNPRPRNKEKNSGRKSPQCRLFGDWTGKVVFLFEVFVGMGRFKDWEHEKLKMGGQREWSNSKETSKSRQTSLCERFFVDGWGMERGREGPQLIPFVIYLCPIKQ